MIGTIGAFGTNRKSQLLNAKTLRVFRPIVPILDCTTVLNRLELGVVGAFARGCHDAGIAQFCLLSAVGSTARSRFRYVRVMGMKEDTVRNIGFTRLAIFRPGIIVGNAHTPAWVGWLGSLVPGPFGNIDQQILGRSIAAEIALHSREAGEVIRENAAMKKLAAQFKIA